MKSLQDEFVSLSTSAVKTQILTKHIDQWDEFIMHSQAKSIIKSYLLPRFQRADITVNDRGLIYFLYGYFRTGKSFLVRHFARLMKVGYKEWWHSSQHPIIIINLNNDINTANQLLLFLLDQLGRPVHVKVINEWARAQLLRVRLQSALIRHLEQCGTRMLILDEAQKMLTARNPNVADIFELFKDLSTKSNWNGDLATQIVLCGTQEGIPLLEATDWIQGRTRIIELHPLEEIEYGAFLFNIYNEFIQLGVSKAWTLVDDSTDPNEKVLNEDMALYLFKRTKGRVGLTVDLIRNAVLFALDNGRSYPLQSDYDMIRLNEKEYKLSLPIKKKASKKTQIILHLEDRLCQITNCPHHTKPYASYRALFRHYKTKHPKIDLLFASKDDSMP